MSDVPRTLGRWGTLQRKHPEFYFELVPSRTGIVRGKRSAPENIFLSDTACAASWERRAKTLALERLGFHIAIERRLGDMQRRKDIRDLVSFSGKQSLKQSSLLGAQTAGTSPALARRALLCTLSILATHTEKDTRCLTPLGAWREWVFYYSFSGSCKRLQICRVPRTKLVTRPNLVLTPIAYTDSALHLRLGALPFLYQTSYIPKKSPPVGN